MKQKINLVWPCGLDEKLWIQCDGCKLWMHTSCVDVESDIPDVPL